MADEQTNQQPAQATQVIVQEAPREFVQVDTSRNAYMEKGEDPGQLTTKVSSES